MKDSKKIYSALFFIGSLLAMSCNEEPMTPIKLANGVLEEYKQHSSISYDIDYQIKHFNQTQDTTEIKAKVELIRETNDSIFGGYIWITTDSVSWYYNTESLYMIYHAMKKITKYPKKKTSPISGHVIDATHRTYFLKPNRLIKGINNPVTSVTLTEDRISNRDTWKVNYKIEDNGDVTNSGKNIWIDKESLTVPKINYYADSQGENQYNQWDIKNVSFNKITRDDLEKRLSSFIEIYEMEEYKEEVKNQFMTLANGTTIPNLQGVIYTDKTKIKLHDYLDKLTLYDVWYMDCPPCIKAIPHLNDLYKKYGDMGLKMVGLNPLNNNEKDIKRMPNFLGYNKIDYPIVFLDRVESKQLQIQVYPTFYLVDHEGKILHSGIGFDEEKAKYLDAQLKEYLTK